MTALSFAQIHENPQLLFYQEGIALAFFADGGGETVAGIDDGVVGQCEEFVDQRVHHFFHGAAPQVGAAYASGKKRVSGEELRRGDGNFS